MRIQSFILATLAFIGAGSTALAQWQGPNPLADTWLGVPFWQHPKGDVSKIPCTHVTQQHPAGHDGPAIPCTHLEIQHPDGHDTGQKAPCTHIENFKPKHPNGHPIIAPCAHMGPQHPNGHPGPKVPCTHLVKQHPDDHDGPNVPCVHILPVKRKVNELGLWFYTDDAPFQAEAIATATKLKQLGLMVGSPRPLHLFFRPPANGTVSVDDPLWSHYNPGFHSVQVLKGVSGWQQTLHHELGHSTLGHTCVQIIGGGKHSLTAESKPGTAMSEGWGTFVALVVENERSNPAPIYRGLNYETATFQNGNALDKYSPNIEFLVSCFLWDLFDTSSDGADSLAVSFQDIFRVFSPTLKTLPNGPIIPNLDDYVNRFSKNNPQHSSVASLVKVQNTTAPGSGKKTAATGRSGRGD